MKCWENLIIMPQDTGDEKIPVNHFQLKVVSIGLIVG